MTAWLLEHAADKKIFVIGEAPLTSALLAAGLTLTEDAREVDIVVASYDRTFEYRKLQIAFDALAVHRRAILVTTNPDVFCPFPAGHGEPDAGAIVAAIEACTGAKCQEAPTCSTRRTTQQTQATSHSGNAAPLAMATSTDDWLPICHGEAHGVCDARPSSSTARHTESSNLWPGTLADPSRVSSSRSPLLTPLPLDMACGSGTHEVMYGVSAGQPS